MRQILLVVLFIAFTIPHVQANDCRGYAQKAFDDFKEGVTIYGYTGVFSNYDRPTECRREYADGWNQASEYFKTRPAPRSYAAPMYNYRGLPPTKSLNETIAESNRELRQRQMQDTLNMIQFDLEMERYRSNRGY